MKVGRLQAIVWYNYDHYYINEVNIFSRLISRSDNRLKKERSSSMTI